MNIFFHELRAYRKSTLIWTFAILLTMIIFMSMYPAFTKDLQITKKLLEGFPEPIRKAIGISMDSFFTLLGFYSFVFSYIVLCGSIQAMNFGLSIVSKESTFHTADFLLTKPIKRAHILTAKLGAIVSSLLFTNLMYCIFAWVTLFFLKTEPFQLTTFLLISITLFFVQMIFMSLGLLISVLITVIKSVITISLASVFGFFILDLFNSVVRDQKLRYIIPYKYFDSMYIISHGRYETPYLLIAFGWIFFSILVSYKIYSNKDFLI
jgi:ABC-2 type transport system permease protein